MNVLYGATTAAFAIQTANVATDGATPFDFLSPIISTGMVGIILLMVLFRIKIMPTYVYDDAKAVWEAERARMTEEWDRERQQYKADLDEAKKQLASATGVYTEQVIPTLTRVLDNERELLEIRRSQQRRSD